MKRIDSHQHFWQVDRGDYAWLTPELTGLYKDHLPQSIQQYLTQESISQTILVQAADTVAETDFILALAEQHDFIAGVVGWIDMESSTAIEQLTRLNQNPYFKGVRPMIQDIVDVNWMLKSELAPVFDYLIANDLTFDALVKLEHIDALLQLLKRYPTLKVVINHGAKPDIASNQCHQWFEQIELVAKETSAYCKLSGLITEASINTSMAALTPYMEHLYSVFGSQRLMWGSDWPVINLAADYPSWIKCLENFLSKLPVEQQQSIWAENAQSFYRI
ncbi:amidohydrolase family protein [Shewanella sp. 10N.7]|uniref:amidohydrolase family protein n=1 Tax=Shewanella sp. 10N.7 TaxID=2885093 RepID=UPI001E41B327|nr:amidohydrolase family protein [Shewanella sp. 10N.7]MCC4831821.1 amidohydrolase family protein [Shewanella sp. 10N.7]